MYLFVSLACGSHGLLPRIRVFIRVVFERVIRVGSGCLCAGLLANIFHLANHLFQNFRMRLGKVIVFSEILNQIVEFIMILLEKMEYSFTAMSP